MGFLSSVFDAAREANEEAHGTRLLEQTQSIFQHLENLSGPAQHAALEKYVLLIERMSLQMLNWSREGRIKLGRSMQKEGRDSFDFDMSGGMAKWLAGAWLESAEINSRKADMAHRLLVGFAEYIRTQLPNISD